MCFSKSESSIKKVFSKFNRSEFFRNATILSSGTALAQAISIFSAPILTRLYFPEDYGLLGIYMVFCALAATLCTVQYHHAIITAEKDCVAKKLLSLSFVISVFVSMLLAIVVLCFRSPIAIIYKSEHLSKWLLFSPISIFFIGSDAVFSAWAVRKKKFKLLSANRVISAFVAPAFSIFLGILIQGPLGLFVGLLASQIIPVLSMGYFFFRTDKLRLTFDREELFEAARRFKNFPLFSMPSAFINNISNQIPILIVTQAAGMKAVGWYNLSARMLGLPATLVSTAIADVFRQRATHDYYAFGTCRPIFMKVFKTLLLASVIPFLILVFFSPEIFSFVFGERWRGAGSVTQVLAVLYTAKFVVSPLTYTTVIANKQWVGLLIDILLLLSLLGVLYAENAYHLSFYTSLTIYALTYSSLYFLSFYLSYKFTINDKFVKKN